MVHPYAVKEDPAAFNWGLAEAACVSELGNSGDPKAS